jgi:hypothetical protein
VCLFTAHVGSGSSLLSCGVFLPPPLYKLSHSWLLGVSHRSCLLWPAYLFIVPPLRHSGHPPSLLRVFIVLIAYYSVSLFFPGWGSVCPGGYADLAQGCLWEYHVPLISPCGPRLPKPSGHWHLAAREPSLFLCLTCSGDSLHRLEVWRGQSFASSRWFFL